MSNLGMYQTITTISKKVGGPGNFIGGLVLGGVVLGVAGTTVVSKAVTICKKIVSENRDNTCKTYRILVNANSNEGLQLYEGDQIKILERDGDAVLIERTGDDNSPYYVSAVFLSSISDFTLK